MCRDRAAFVEYKKTTTVRTVFSAKNSAQLKAFGQGTVNLRIWNGIAWINARLEDALPVQDLSKNLFSLTAASRGMTVEISGDGYVVKKSDG